MNFKDMKPQNIPHSTQILAKLDVLPNFTTVLFDSFKFKL